MSAVAPPPATRRVWSLPIRAGHWALAATVIGAIVLHEGGPWHLRLGYAALALVAWRSLHGWLTRDPFTRFATFVTGPARTWAYARAVMARREPHHLGHNPLGGWMIVALLGAAGTAAASGALYDTDAFWGNAIVYTVHQVAGWALAVLVPLHVAGVLFTSRRQHENLLKAMLTGHKRDPDDGTPLH